MTRLTFAGALFLTVIAVLPQALYQGLNLPYTAAQFFGGTGLLIIVGVVLDTMRQVETHLLQRHYDGFLRKGRLRAGRDYAGESGRGGALVAESSLIWLYVLAAILLIAGTTILVAYYRR
jgi:preprotein translocase subunit SecY